MISLSVLACGHDFRVSNQDVVDYAPPCSIICHCTNPELFSLCRIVKKCSHTDVKKNMSSKTRPPPTVIQDIALNLVFAVMGERRINRTQQEYASIAAKLPPLKKLVFKINELLVSIHKHAALSGVPLPQICRFQTGDKR